ncbi:ABC transporter ATP-binding protein [Acanthopleuribacter pedis]|uniref:ABC transporter ATP-binding protein n=1 Tax=Acanthopleuribacter pedis TaxID=442870 RepID=A0A8J7U4X2_9BACT|nr:ABC transporter ATP-binding protein [Acanthopleuribacter pedis]MBO1319903.1 ABC transporter ATP-binding protein [Acanthopleuribacter pedis]
MTTRGEPAPSPLTLEHLNKGFGEERILNDISLTIYDKETTAVLGRSGSGKTTLLKIIAGLESRDSGHIREGARDIAAEPPQKRGFVYLYQEPLLLPHLNLYENIAFGLRLQRRPAAEIEERVTAMIEELGLNGHRHKMPNELSGGQRQRVAFGRALIVHPRLLLLDEPFSSLDGEIRTRMQLLYKRVARRFQITALFVTHDLKEALLMGDRFAVIEDGRLTAYPDRRAFMMDPRSGVSAEKAFWENLEMD